MVISSRRSLIRIVSLMCAVVLTLGAAAVSGNYKARKLERINAVSQQRALSELTESMADIETALGKEIYAGTPAMTEKLAGEIRLSAARGKSSLSALPVSDILLENTYKFLSQAGAFSEALGVKAARGEKISEEEKENLRALYRYSKELGGKLEFMCSYLDGGGLTFEETENAVKGDKNGDTLKFSSAIGDAEQVFSDYPTLIYDGPFSDGLLKKSPKFIQGKDEVSEEAALKAAAEFSGIDKNSLKRRDDENGKLTLYTFVGADDGVTLGITKKGGYPAYMLGSEYAGASKLSEEEAVAKARDYLGSHGIKNMHESYYSVNDGICTVNFAYVQDDVICYSDLIKVSVAMDTGKIISFDSRDYLMSHYIRSDLTPKITAREGEKSLSGSLTVKDTKIALIPTDSGKEVLCYEYFCKGEDNEDILVYINARNGREENMLFLLYGDNGILVR